MKIGETQVELIASEVVLTMFPTPGATRSEKGRVRESERYLSLSAQGAIK